MVMHTLNFDVFGQVIIRNLVKNIQVLSLKSDSHLPKKMFYFRQRKPFKSDQKCFLFHLESSFCSQDVSIFVMTFWSGRKSGLIRKIRLISKFMTSQPGQQTITIHKSPNISQSKGNRTMEFGRVIEYKIELEFSSRIMQNMRRGDKFQTSFCFLKKLYMR